MTAATPEFAAYMLSNALVLVLGSVLTVLSAAAYRRAGEGSFGIASAGFALITLGSVVEAIYELGIRRSVDLTGRELLALHAVEGVIIALGLGALFLSLRRY
jgi:hypothetical protein